MQDYSVVDNSGQEKYYALIRAALQTEAGKELIKTFRGMLMNPVAHPSMSHEQACWNEGRNSVFREIIYACQEFNQ